VFWAALEDHFPIYYSSVAVLRGDLRLRRQR